jgi:hypothetical protein
VWFSYVFPHSYGFTWKVESFSSFGIVYLLLPSFLPLLSLSLTVRVLSRYLLSSTSLPQSLSWYPPRPYHRPSLGTHQSRHFLTSTPLSQTLRVFQTHHRPSLGTHHLSCFVCPPPIVTHPHVILPPLILQSFSSNLSLGLYITPPLVMMSLWTHG